MADGTDPETELELTTPENEWSQVGAQLLWAPVDPIHGNKFTFDASALLIATNSDSTDSHVLAVSSQPDPQTGRYGDIEVDIEPGEFRIFQFKARGWKDSLGFVVLPAGQSDQLMVAVVAQ